MLVVGLVFWRSSWRIYKVYESGGHASTVLEKEGTSLCPAIVLLLAKGKTNQTGKVESMGFIRNKDPEVCPVGAFAFHFFEMFQLCRRPFPNLVLREWYDEPLFVGNYKNFSTRRTLRPITYNSMAETMDFLIKELRIITNNFTHYMRVAAACYLDKEGVPYASIKRAGRWNQNNALDDHYLKTLPRDAMRAFAQFPANTRSYFLPRSHVEPPESLVSKVFPFINNYVDIFAQRPLPEGAPQDMTSQVFVKVLSFLRVFLLQDSALLIDLYPSSTIFQHEIFTSKEFIEYKREVITSNCTIEEPLHQRIEQIMPSVAQSLDNIRNTVTTGLNDLTRSLSMQQENWDRFNSVVSASRSLLEGTRQIAEDTLEQLPPPIVSATDRSDDLSFSRNVATVPEAWREWTAGVDNKRSIEQMDEESPGWYRTSDAKRMFYKRRKIIIDHVKRVSEADRISVEGSVQRLEQLRQDRGFTLNKLQEHIRRLSNND